MRARDLVESAPVIDADASAIEALRTLSEAGLPGIVVKSGGTYVVVPASQALRVGLPQYVIDDPSLGRVWDDPSAEGLMASLIDRRAGDLVAALHRREATPEQAVDADATVVEIAAVMSAARIPLVAVVDRGEFLGVVTVNGLVRHLLS